MSANTGIEWTNATWNPLRGCTRVSEGCRNCYAEGVAARFSGPGQPYEGLASFVGAARVPRWTGKVALAEHMLDQPLRWRKPRRIFVNSMSDLFHESVPDEWIDKIFAVMALCPDHTFQVLTKRPERMREYLKPFDGRRADSLGRLVIAMGYNGPLELLRWPLHNVWLGVSVEDQATADERIPLLLDTPAAKRFISAEPLLGPVDLQTAWHGEDALDIECWGDCAWCNKGLPPLHNCQKGRQTESAWEKGRSGLDWIIVGGESGPNARPMHPDWVRSLRDQCAEAGVSFFFKQWGSWREVREGDVFNTKYGRAGKPPAFIVRADGTVHCFDAQDGDVAMICVGKKSAGHLLDGRDHREFPA